MFLRKIFFIALVVAVFQAPVLSADCENPAKKNVVQLLKQGQKLAGDKQFVSAISKYNKALEELNRVSSYTVESRLEYSIVNALAEAYFGLCESKTAESYYNRALHFEYIKPKEEADIFMKLAEMQSTSLQKYYFYKKAYSAYPALKNDDHFRSEYKRLISVGTHKGPMVCPEFFHDKFNHPFVGPAQYRLFKSTGKEKLKPVADLRVDNTGHIDLVLLNQKPFRELTKEQAESLFGPQKSNHLEGCKLYYHLYSENKKQVFYLALIFKNDQIWKFRVWDGALGCSNYEIVNGKE